MIAFDDAPATFGQLLINFFGPEAALEGRILRDIYGRLSFITSLPYDARWDELQSAVTKVLGVWGGSTTQLVVSLSGDEPRFRALLGETSAGVAIPGQQPLRMIDRRLAGDDWLSRPSPLVANPSRIIFYSVKGESDDGEGIGLLEKGVGMHPA
jgi:hypothetical protein